MNITTDIYIVYTGMFIYSFINTFPPYIVEVASSCGDIRECRRELQEEKNQYIVCLKNIKEIHLTF